MMASAYSGHLCVCKWLFEKGAVEDVTKVDKNGVTALLLASQQGHVSVCKWLVNAGAAKQITQVDDHGNSPMLLACHMGHLSVCKWLWQIGAEATITKADEVGYTPMLRACTFGHLFICQWLFEVGAAADITKANDAGQTPLHMACRQNHHSVCEWLICNGALNNPSDGHVDTSIVRRDISRSNEYLLTWANNTLAVHDIFLNVVLLASVVLPESVQQNAQEGMEQQCICRLPLLSRGLLECIGDFIGVIKGRPLRNVSELRAALLSLG